MDERFDDYFQLLEVHFTASEDVIKAAFKKLCQRYHPDNDGDCWQLAKVNEAYEVLMNDVKRKKYFDNYIRHYGNIGILTRDNLVPSQYDLSINPIRHVLLEYLFLIKNYEYYQAYTMLSEYNHRHLFRKDFLEWQRLISEVYELVEFDCTYLEAGVFGREESRYLRHKKYIKFRVKVVEKNHLLECQDEDYFDRALIFEEDGWHILLEQKKVKSIIKKYKKLVSIINRKNDIGNDANKSKYYAYKTGVVSRQSFINNCEHEQMRFIRYGSSYSVIAIKTGKKLNISHIQRILKGNTRELDSITYLKRGIFLILLPETNQVQGNKVGEKLHKLLQRNDQEIDAGNIACQEQVYESVKELLRWVAS